MNSEIITIANFVTSKIAFKNQALQDCTERISKIYTNAYQYAEEKNREIALILAEIQKDRLYLEDGFKSVADYAEQTFNLKKTNAHMLANAGRVYLSDNVNPALKEFSPSKVAELTSLHSDAVNKALETGRISKYSTQKELREFAIETKANCETRDTIDSVKKPIEFKYTCHLHTCNELVGNLSLPNIATLKEYEEQIVQFIREHYYEIVEVINLPRAKKSVDSKKATVIRKLFLSENCSLVCSFEKYVEKHKKVNKSKYTKEELLAMIAELDVEID